MEWLKDLFIKKGEEWIFKALDANQVPNEFVIGDPLAADESYLTITLRSMRIVNVRVATARFYGVVNSFVTINHSSGSVASFQSVTTPTELQKLDARNIDKVIPCNIPIVGPVPYRGEEVSLQIGLFSVKEDNLAEPFIKLLESMSSLAGVSVLSATIPYLQPIRQGMEAITGTGADTTLNIGISTTLNPPVTGWYLVMGAPKGEIDILQLEVTPNDFRLVDKQTKKPFKDFPYMLFTITQKREREDFYKLPYLKEAYQNLQQTIRAGNRNDAEEFLKVFKRAAFTSDDLLFTDSQRIIDLVEARAKEVMKATFVSAGKDEMPPLDSFPLYQ